MYIPKAFEQKDQEVIKQLIRDYPLATLIANSSSGLHIDHIPLRMEDGDDKTLRLQGHIALTNPLWKANIERSVTTVFQGPQQYISPNWYPTKQDNGKAVPTWNYTAVHMTGDIRFIEDDEWKMHFLDNLTKDQEAGQTSPWAMSDAPPSYIKKMLAALLGFEVSVRQVEAKWKVSQNQPAQNQQGIYQALVESGVTNAALLSGNPES